MNSAANSDSLWLTARHEAGHAVAAFCVGWGLRWPGIVLAADGGGNTSVLPDFDNWSLWKYVHVAFSGPYSEVGNAVRTDERRLDSVRVARHWIQDDKDEGHSIDALQAAGMAIQLAPKATDEQIADLVKRLELETFDLARAPAFVARVERVAAVLAENGEVSPLTFNSLM